MTQNIHTLEDMLEALTGVYPLNATFNLDPNDATILVSMARQTARKIALTDRQHALAKQKLLPYQEQFEKNNCLSFHETLDVLRRPLRSIDRSKTISIETEPFETKTGFRTVTVEGPYIQVRFPFSKKNIVAIGAVAAIHKKNYWHENGTPVHRFAISEQVVYDLISAFKDRNFEIDQELMETYSQILEIKSAPEKYIPGIYNGKLLNIHPSAKLNMTRELGELNTDNLIAYIDRKRRYGISHIDAAISPVSLTEKIATRETPDMLIKPTEYNLQSIFHSLHELDRFPLIVLLDEAHAEKQIYNVYNQVSNFISSSEQSVLFRLEGESEFNNFVKSKSLNNWVDENTKIVYINSIKLPKLAISADWKPIAALAFGSKLNKVVDTYVQNYCDLIIYNDEDLSLFRKHSNYYGNM